MIYSCDRCNKIFKQKSNYLAHNRRKKSCINTNMIEYQNKIDCNSKLSTIPHFTTKNTQKNLKNHQKVGIILDDLTCSFCTKVYSRKDSLLRHLNICKTKLSHDNDIENKDKLIELLIEEKNLLAKQNALCNKEITELRAKITDISKLIINKNNKIICNSNNNINSHNQITNNIVVKFGHENINKLSFEEKLKICSSSFAATKNYIESLYFNKRLPEFHNVYVSDKKFKYGLVYDGKKFELQHLDFIIDELLETSTDNIQQMIEEHDIFEKLTPNKIKHIKMLIYQIKTSNDEVFIRERKYEIKMILYNNRKLILNTHKLPIE